MEVNSELQEAVAAYQTAADGAVALGEVFLYLGLVTLGLIIFSLGVYFLARRKALFAGLGLLLGAGLVAGGTLATHARQESPGELKQATVALQEVLQEEYSLTLDEKLIPELFAREGAPPRAFTGRELLEVELVLTPAGWEIFHSGEPYSPQD